MDGLRFEEPAHLPQRPGQVVVAPAQHGDRARRRRVEAHDHAHRGRLARPVGPEEAGHGPRAHVERQVVHRHHVAESLREPSGLNHLPSLAWGHVPWVSGMTLTPSLSDQNCGYSEPGTTPCRCSLLVHPRFVGVWTDRAVAKQRVGHFGAEVQPFRLGHVKRIHRSSSGSSEESWDVLQRPFIIRALNRDLAKENRPGAIPGPVAGSRHRLGSPGFGAAQDLRAGSTRASWRERATGRPSLSHSSPSSSMSPSTSSRVR